MDERTRALFADAERSAERVVGQLRMAMALSLGAGFAITVVTHAQRDETVLAVQIAAATTTLVAYLVLGALSYHLAVPHRFRPWMPWAFVTGDDGFLLINVGLNVFTTGIGGNYLASFPALWFAPLVLAFSALQYNPARAVYATALLAGGLVVAAAARMRSLLQSAIDETRRRANLARYLPAEIAESGLTALREGRRQAVAVMFVDMRGFTRRAETLDPAATGRLLADFRRFVVAAATRYAGVVDKFVGDSAMLVFGLPSPRPDDARRALNCALALLAGTPGG